MTNKKQEIVNKLLELLRVNKVATHASLFVDDIWYESLYKEPTKGKLLDNSNSEEVEQEDAIKVVFYDDSNIDYIHDLVQEFTDNNNLYLNVSSELVDFEMPDRIYTFVITMNTNKKD